MAWNREYLRQEREQQVMLSPQNSHERESLGELLGNLATQSASLVRDEVALARQELLEKLKTVRSATIVIAIGAMLALVSMLVFSATIILSLAEYLKPWQSALIVGAFFALVAAITITVGIGQLKQTSLKPEQTIVTLEEDKEWLKEIT